MGLLRSLAAVGRLDRGSPRYCCGFIGGPGASPAPPSQRARLAQRQRHPTAARCRAGLSRRSEKIRLVQAGSLFGRRKTGGAYRQLGHENAGAVRLRAAELLADRHAVRRRLRLQHGNQRRPCAAAARKPERNAPRESPLADRRCLEFSRRRRRSEEHTSELQSPCNLVCRLLLEKKKKPTV